MLVSVPEFILASRLDFTITPIEGLPEPDILELLILAVLWTLQARFSKIQEELFGMVALATRDCMNRGTATNPRGSAFD